MPKLTVLITSKNEEVNIRDCLESARWADELLVVDSGSKDRTVEIAREFTDRILVHEYEGAAAQKNWAIPQASHDWVFVLDSDERVTPGLRDEIRRLLQSDPPYPFYNVYRKNWFLGVPIRHCGWERDKVIRLFRRDQGRYAELRVHAEVKATGPVGVLENKLEHYTYRSFDQYLEKFNRYTTWSALDLDARGRKTTFSSLVFRPFFRFVKMYVLRQGFRDGLAGLILCLLAAFSVMMKYAKLWAIRRVKAGEKGVETGRTRF